MQIRGEITYSSLNLYESVPLEAEIFDLPHSIEWVHVDESLYNPAEAEKLAIVRAHCIDNPEGVLLDVYQGLTELGLKDVPGTLEAQKRILKGLRGETAELHQELLLATLEHPANQIVEELDDIDDMWIATVLNPYKLRFLHLSPERKEHYLSELGDVLWYASRLASECRAALSDCIFELLLAIRAGDLDVRVQRGDEQGIRLRFGKIMDFDLFQAVALNLEDKVTEQINRGMPIEQKVTIDSMPATLLSIIAYDELWPPNNSKDEWEDDNSYSQLPNPEVTVGKLLWFVAYTAHSVLNTDFNTVMKANLQKLVSRGKRGTLFEKDSRTSEDEARIAGLSARLPLN